MATSAPLSLLELAELDREVFELLSSKQHLSSIAGFHAQQAVEKALKALLEAKSITFPKTHNLLVLTDLLRDAGFACPAEERSIVLLIRYAVEGRYDTSGLSAINIAPIRTAVQSVLDWTQSEINQTKK